MKDVSLYWLIGMTRRWLHPLQTNIYHPHSSLLGLLRLKNDWSTSGVLRPSRPPLAGLFRGILSDERQPLQQRQQIADAIMKGRYSHKGLFHIATKIFQRGSNSIKRWHEGINKLNANRIKVAVRAERRPGRVSGTQRNHHTSGPRRNLHRYLHLVPGWLIA